MSLGTMVNGEYKQVSGGESASTLARIAALETELEELKQEIEFEKDETQEGSLTNGLMQNTDYIKKVKPWVKKITTKDTVFYKPDINGIYLVSASQAGGIYQYNSIYIILYMYDNSTCECIEIKKSDYYDISVNYSDGISIKNKHNYHFQIHIGLLQQYESL